MNPNGEPKKKKYTLERPSLLRRVFAAMMDFILVVAVFIGLEVLLYNTFFKAVGYQDTLSEIYRMYDDSHLYVFKEESGYWSLKEVYDDKKTPEENYDAALIYYYSNDPRAAEANLLETYTETKLNSSYFELKDGEIVRTETATDASVKAFFEKEYDKAINFFESDKDYIGKMKYTFYIMLFSLVFSITVTTAVFYLAIPLMRKDGETLFQMLNRMGLADSRTDSRIKKSQVVIRYFVFLTFNFLIPLFLYYFWGYFSLITIFVTLTMVCITPSNSGIHEYISHTYVVTKRNGPIPEKPRVEVETE